MNSKKYIFDNIPEEIDSNQIDPIIGQKSPIIRPKLDDTIPSLLNLSSEMSSMQKTYKDDSFNMTNFNNNYFKSNTIIPIFNNPKSKFIKSHYKSFSNEVFTNPKIFNVQEKEKNNKNNEEDDDSSYYGGELNFDGVINFWGDNNKEENEDGKKGLLIENEAGIENKIENVIEEDINEGYNILNMLKKEKMQNKN